MSTSQVFLHDARWIWLAWVIGVGCCCLLFMSVARGIEWRRLRHLHHDESGSAHTISYTMTLILYLLFVLLVIETTFMLVSKLGTIYSAFAATRSAIVWYPSATPDEAGEKVKFAARKSFAPFANGIDRLGDAGGAVDSEIEDYLDAYGDHAIGEIARTYTRSKFLHTIEHLKVDSSVPDGGPPDWNTDITVTVTYHYPIHIWLFGPFFGQREPDGKYYMSIASKTTLQNEGPRNDQQRMGIRYLSKYDQAPF